MKSVCGEPHEMFRQAILLMFCGAIFATDIPQMAHAAMPAAGPSATTDDSADVPVGLEEIVVTAQRRSENSQRVPIATAAISASVASELGITDTQSLVQTIPGLNFTRSASASLPFLRGVGTPVAQPGDEPSVAYYVDDVYMPAGSSSFANFASIDSIEVEKGPQGTLFGRNATGGVVQVSTKNPSSVAAADVAVTYGNYNTAGASLYLTGPIAEHLSANVAVYGSNQADGWGRNRCAALYADLGCTTSGAAFTAYDFGGRAKLLYTPTDQTTLLLTVDFDQTRTQEGLGFHTQAGTLTTIYTPSGPAGVPPASGFYDPVEDEPTFSRPLQGGASLKLTEDMSWSRLVSISAWRETRSFYNLDDDAGPTPFIDTHLRYVEYTWTQELRLLSPEAKSSGWLSWITGLYYMHDRAEAPYQFYGAAFGAVSPANTVGTQITNSYSAFAQATATVLPDTHLTLGTRYTIDDRSFDASVFYPVLDAGFEDLNSLGGKLPTYQSFRSPTYRVSLDHDFTPNIMGYLAYNRGFKSGVYNTTISPTGGPVDTPAPVKPEILNSYSAGLKTEFFDHRLRVNVEAFLYKYKNIQINENLAGLTVLSNAASATIKGFDLDIAVRPTQNLTLSVSAEVLDGHYTSFENGVFDVYNPSIGGNTVTAANLSGYRTMQTPPFSLTHSINYITPTRLGSFDYNLSWSHGGNYYFDPDNGRGQINPSLDKQPILNTVNASVAWRTTDTKYDVRLWAKNLTGQKYFSFVSEQAFATEYSPAPPRTYGITAQAHF